MADSGFVSGWSLTQRPERQEIGLAVLFAIHLVSLVSLGTQLSLVWFILGVLVWGIVVGPATETRLGQTVGEWARRIGGAGRLFAIGVFVAVLWGALLVFDVDHVPIYSFGTGGIFVLTVLILTRYLASVVRQTLN